MEPFQSIAPATEKPATTTAPRRDDLRKACGEFESLLVHYIFKAGRKTLPENGLFGDTQESKIYQSMMDEQMALCVSRSRGLGLGDLLYQQLAGNAEKETSYADFV